MAQQTLVLPEKVRLKLTDASGKSVALADVLFRIHAFARWKNDFDLQPFPTNSEGVAFISRSELMAEVSATYDSGLMDYRGIDECSTRVEISALTIDEIQRAIHARTTVWRQLLKGEEKRWSSIKALIELYRRAANGQVRAEPVRADWDGRQSEYEHSVVATIIGRSSLLNYSEGPARTRAFRPTWVLLGSQLFHTISAADQCQARQPDKQSVLNHSWHAIQLPRQRRWIGDLSEAAIENLIAVVGQERTAVGLRAQLGRRA